ncbi:MAG: winged helix-turn-helix transcriptional regulator [Clostridia bacterium]|nr:winged helix-turn-helix transcriptional regulator [Clostridia bacterium]
MKKIDSEIEICEHEHSHDEVVEKVSEIMPSEDVIYDVAELFKVFGDSTRTKILTALFESEMCVCDIGKLINMTKSAISHQLRILRQNKLVKARKSGKEVFYSLADNHVKVIFKMAVDHVEGKDCE